jgi:hypothetical protein
MQRARKTRRSAVPKTNGERNGSDRQGSPRANRLGGPAAAEPAGHGAIAPEAARPSFPPAKLRLLKYADEIARRILRRTQRYRDVRSGGAPLLSADWANERDIDLRIRSGDPISVSDAMRDAAEALVEAAEGWEREHGI